MPRRIRKPPICCSRCAYGKTHLFWVYLHEIVPYTATKYGKVTCSQAGYFCKKRDYWVDSNLFYFYQEPLLERHLYCQHFDLCLGVWGKGKKKIEL